MAIKKVTSVLDDLDLTLSAKKTKLCIFSREDKALRVSVMRHGTKTYQKRPFRSRFRELFNSDRVKFLGLNLQSNLRWTTHINYIKQRCKSTTKLIKCLGHTW